jgi:hypothetical protein
MRSPKEKKSLGFLIISRALYSCCIDTMNKYFKQLSFPLSYKISKNCSKYIQNYFTIIKKVYLVGCQLFTSVIPPTWEAEIRKITFPDQPGQKVHKTASQPKKLGVVVCAHHPSYGRERK